MSDQTATYRLCAHCDHFVEPTDMPETYAQFTHLEDDDHEYDHEPTPSDPARSLSAWLSVRPDLFAMHPDAKIGPNSIHHRMVPR